MDSLTAPHLQPGQTLASAGPDASSGRAGRWRVPRARFDPSPEGPRVLADQGTITVFTALNTWWNLLLPRPDTGDGSALFRASRKIPKWLPEM